MIPHRRGRRGGRRPSTVQAYTLACMELPNAAQVSVEREKLLGYLLSITHPDGRSKAEFFARLGFTADTWGMLQEALRRHGVDNPVVREVESAHGVRYVVEGPLITPASSPPMIRTVWIVEPGSDAPRLVTAYPVRRQDAQRA